MRKELKHFGLERRPERSPFSLFCFVFGSFLVLSLGQAKK